MQLLASREYSVIDYQTMAEFVGHERLFRGVDGSFLLYLSSEGRSETEERIVWLETREAITWLNEAPDQFGSYWESAEVVPLAGGCCFVSFGKSLRIDISAASPGDNTA